MDTEKRIRTETFDCSGPAELDIQIGTGRIEIRTTDSPYVRVELAVEPAQGRAWEKGLEDILGRVSTGEYTPALADAHALTEAKVSFSSERRRLVVRAPRAFRRIGLAVVVEAPQGSRLNASAHRGTLATAGVLADLKSGIGLGEISADRIDGDATVRIGSGDVKLGRVGGKLSVRAGAGEVEVASIEGRETRITTGSGDVWLGVVRSNVHVRTGNGSLAVAEAAEGRLDLVSGSGDVHVAVRPGVVAEIDLAAPGNARSELEVGSQPPTGEPQLRIRARTGAGEAVVARAEL